MSTVLKNARRGQQRAGKPFDRDGRKQGRLGRRVQGWWRRRKYLVLYKMQGMPVVCTP